MTSVLSKINLMIAKFPDELYMSICNEEFSVIQDVFAEYRQIVRDETITEIQQIMNDNYILSWADKIIERKGQYPTSEVTDAQLLRETTGESMLSCKKALISCNGNFNESIKWLYANKSKTRNSIIN